jgi:autotransporter-associated beta strand protein
MKPGIRPTARLSLPLATAIAALLSAHSARGADRWWDGGTSTWTTTSAWSTVSNANTPNPGSAPGGSDNLFFNITTNNTANNVISHSNGNRAALSITISSSGTTNFRAGGSDTAASTLTIGSGGITVNSGAGAVTIGQTPTSYGTITVALGADQTWTNNSSSLLTVPGPVTGASRQLTKAGTGTVRLNGANTYSGATIINNGILQIGNYSGLSNTSGITVSGGGTSNLQLIQVGNGATSNSINKTLSLHGTLSTAGGSGSNTLAQTWGGDITLAGNSTIWNNGNSTFIISGQIDTTISGHDLTFQSDRDGSRIDGKITGAGGLTKTGSRDLLLTNATNDYTGNTTVSAGFLRTPRAAVLSGYDVAGKVIFNGGTISATMGDGSGTGWSTAQVDTLLTNATKTSGAFGIDTANGNLTQWTAFTTTNLGSALGLSKLGANTLTLDQANTYTGTTSILGGTLRLADTGAVGGSNLLAIFGNTVQIATDTAFSGPDISIAGGTISSDRATAGAGLTHVLGNASVSNTTHTFTRGSNVTSGDAAIQLGNITNGSGADGTATFNPTTANLIIAGAYTGVSNAGLNTLALGGSSAANSMTGDITLGTRDNINVTKTGSSLWTLSGNHGALAGTTTISGGALITTTLAALPNNAALTFNGGVLGAQIGGAGWTTGEVDTLLAGATKTSGALGIDTTNGSLTQWAAFTTTNLGSTLGLAKLGANTLTLNSAGNNYAGATIIDQGTLKLDADQTLTGGLTFGFGNNTTSNTGTLDLSTNSATFGGALVVQTNSGSANAISIGSGQTLQINGAVTVGYNSAVNSLTKLTASGAGTLSIGNSGTPTDANVQIGAGTTSGISNTATLDMSGLATFFANTGSGNSFRVGNLTNGSGGSAGGSSVILAVDSTILSGSLVLGSPDSATQSLKLGDGTNTLQVNSLNVGDPNTGRGRSNTSLTFNGAGGTLTLRGFAGGTSRANLMVGDIGQNTGVASSHLFDITGHSADLLVDDLIVGRRLQPTGTFGSVVTANFNFDTGTLDANNLWVGLRTGSSVTSAGSTATVSLAGGTATINNTTTALKLGENTNTVGNGTGLGTLNISGTASVNVAANGGNSIVLGNATVAGGTATGVLNITGGTLTVAGDIVRGATTGTSVATLAVNGATATLDMGGNDITNLTDITYTDGSLKNLGVVNTGITLAGTGSRVLDQGTGVNGEIQGNITGTDIGLTKQGGGKLTLSGTSSYTGATDVNAGTLIVSGNISTSITTTVKDNGILGGGGSVAALIFEGGSFFDIFEAVANTDSLASTTTTFSTSGFGIGSLVYQGAAVNWGSIDNGTYTLITGTLDSTNLDHFGLTNAYDIGGGRSAYFENGSLQLVIIPEPRAALLGGLGLLALLRRRR